VLCQITSMPPQRKQGQTVEDRVGQLGFATAQTRTYWWSDHGVMKCLVRIRFACGSRLSG
jgi:hypothetical protein